MCDPDTPGAAIWARRYVEYAGRLTRRPILVHDPVLVRHLDDLGLLVDDEEIAWRSDIGISFYVVRAFQIALPVIRAPTTKINVAR